MADSIKGSDSTIHGDSERPLGKTINFNCNLSPPRRVGAFVFADMDSDGAIIFRDLKNEDGNTISQRKVIPPAG